MKRKFLLLVAALALIGPAVGATELPYSYVQGAWTNVEPDQGDSGNGPMLDLSYGMTQLVHLVGSYQDVDYDAADATTWEVGAGVHRTLNQSFDLFGEATYVDAEVAAPVGTVSDEGFAVCGGARKALAAAWELGGGIRYVDIGQSDDTLLGVNALYTMKDRYAIGAGYETGDADTLHVGFRMSFGQR